MSHSRQCSHCGGEVFRRGTRGRWPDMCQGCRDDPEVERLIKKRRHEAKVAAAKTRIDNLIAKLQKKGNGS